MDVVLRLGHLLAAAVWFGAMLTTAGDVRRSLAGRDVPAMIERVQRQLILSLVAGLFVIVTGAVMVLSRGGFRGARISLAFGLSLMALMIEGQMLAPTTRALASDSSAPKRFYALTGILHLLRTVVFGLMVLRP